MPSKTKTKKGHLFSDDNPNTTVKGYGFQDEKIAEKTIKDLKNRDTDYQFQVVNTMYHRGLVVLKKTKNTIKHNNINKAVTIYKKWLTDYKKTKPQVYNYLSVKNVNDLEFLADYYNISLKARGLEKPTKSDKGFLEVWRMVKGDKKKLRNLPVLKNNPNGETWDKHRNNYITRRLSMLKNTKDGLYYKDGPDAGLPSRLHVNMLMWGYSPDKKHILKQIKSYEKLIKMRKA
jgi:hypothetical protein